MVGGLGSIALLAYLISLICPSKKYRKKKKEDSQEIEGVQIFLTDSFLILN